MATIARLHFPRIFPESLRKRNLEPVSTASPLKAEVQEAEADRKILTPGRPQDLPEDNGRSFNDGLSCRARGALKFGLSKTATEEVVRISGRTRRQGSRTSHGYSGNVN